MKKIKQIITLLVFSTFLFTACDNRNEVEEVAACNYTFTATPAATNIEINTPLAITLNIEKLSTVNCDANYAMDVDVKRDDVSINNVFNYSGDLANMSVGSSTGTFTAVERGTYVLTFTVTNTGADTNNVQVQTMTINVTYPPIQLTLFEDNINRNKEVFVTQDANYTFTFSGGNPNNDNYSILLTTTGDDLAPAVTFLSLGTEVSPLTSPLTFRITPSQLGTATYTIKVSQDGISTSQDFTLTSKAPEFDLRLRLNGTESHPDGTPSDTIDASNEELSNLQVNIQNFTSGYTGVTMNYTFAIENGEFNSSEHSSNGINDTRGTPIPSSSFRYIIEAKPDGSGYFTGVKEIKVTVTNTEYGFSKTKSIWINIVP